MSDGVGSGQSSNIERQLGEVVGTVRMAVAAIETMRDTVERLAERAAFRADLEALRIDLRRDISDMEMRLEHYQGEMERQRQAYQEALERQRGPVSVIQRWMWMVIGGSAVVVSLLAFFKTFVLSAISQ